MLYTTVRKQRDECWVFQLFFLRFSQLATPAYEIVPDTFRVGLPTPVKHLWESPHRIVHRGISMVIPESSQQWRLPTPRLIR